MNSENLKYFVCVADRENVTKAAKEMYISQPTLSGIIASIEKEAGARLFERNGHKIQLTEEGKIFREYANKMIRLSDAKRRKIKGDEEPYGILRVAIKYNTDSNMRIFSEFHKKYPKVPLRIYSRPFQNMGESDYKNDFKIISEDEAQGMEYRLIAKGRQLYAIMRKDHPLAGKNSLELKDLKKEQFIFSVGEDGEMESVYQYCLDSGLNPDIAFYYEGIQYQLETVLNAGAIAISYNVFREFRDSMEQMVSIPIHYVGEIHENIVIAWDPQNFNPLIPLMVECVEKALDDRRNKKKQ